MEKIVLGVIANILRTYAIYRFIHLLYFPKVENKVLKNGVYILFVVLTSGGYYILQNTYVNIMTNLTGLVLIVSIYPRNFLKRYFDCFSVYIL